MFRISENNDKKFKLSDKNSTNESESKAYESNNFVNSNKNTHAPRISIGKNVIITSALPYANGEIHLGHIASTYLPADIFTRFLKLTGTKAYHICATDDFGTPILIKAENEGKSPEEYVRAWNIKDKEDFKSVGIEFDYFSKTSSQENIAFVQQVFLKLYDKHYVKEETVVQYYCTVDKKYLPDRYVIGTCPFCNAQDQYSDLCESCGRVPEKILDPKCILCGATPVMRESLHYFFKLSEFGDRLENWLTGNKNLQTDIVKYVLNWINSGLQDWDITRDLSWGVPIPQTKSEGDFRNKVFYGWFDNHLCYISSFNEFSSLALKTDGKELWNNSEIIHFIGKDIIYHHYLFLPAIRMGIDSEYKLPDRIITRGHLLFQNRKLSKSKNWSISLKGFTRDFNSDYLRFYLASIIPFSQSDVNFDWDTFYEKINNELISNVGNFVNRTLTFTQKQFGGVVPFTDKFDLIDLKVLEEIRSVVFEVGNLIYHNQIDKALKKILQISTQFNQYFQSKEPWKSPSSANNTMWISVNCVRTMSILLYPFIPNSSIKIWNQLGMQEELADQNWYLASDPLIKGGHEISKDISPIFKRIEKEEIELIKAKHSND
jgi:methionyl-tRNA synthetase